MNLQRTIWLSYLLGQQEREFKNCSFIPWMSKLMKMYYIYLMWCNKKKNQLKNWSRFDEHFERRALSVNVYKHWKLDEWRRRMSFYRSLTITNGNGMEWQKKNWSLGPTRSCRCWWKNLYLAEVRFKLQSWNIFPRKKPTRPILSTQCQLFPPTESIKCTIRSNQFHCSLFL